MSNRWMAVGFVALALAACGGKDEGTGPAKTDEIVGTWLSTGTNVAPGLRAAPFKVKQITATFNANNTYTVVSTDSANANTTFTGTWTSAAGSTAGVIRAISLSQATPAALTSQGIFQVTGTTMKYEVIQTTPAIQGFTPPTVSGGFGSTAFNGTALGAIWTQTFVKQ